MYGWIWVEEEGVDCDIIAKTWGKGNLSGDWGYWGQKARTLFIVIDL